MKQNTPASPMAQGVIRRALRKPHWSDSHPRIEGETASPRAWIKKMLTAKAMARTAGLVTLRITVLSGPVLRKRKNSAINIADMHEVKPGARIAQTAKGVPIRNPH